MKVLFFTIVTLFTIPAFTQQTAFHNVLFDVDKHEIKSSEKLKLTAFIEGLNSEEILSIELKGHTDSDAGDKYNLQLSKRRVAIVNAFLIDEFEITPSIAYFGERKPINGNETTQQKEKNRRVEVAITFKPKVIIQEKDISELYKLTSKDLDEFCIDPNKDTTLTLEEGTLITIKANTFNTGAGCVKIKTKEIYKYSDMILENLSTTSDGSQLETGGMIYIEAKDANGRELKPQKSLTILMPTTNPQEDMDLFYGDMHDDGVNWQSSNTGMSVISEGFWLDCYNGYYVTCDFFFCRIGRTGKGIKGIFNKNQRKENRAFRKSIGSYRQTNSNRYWISGNTRIKCDSLQKLLDLYDVNSYNDLILAMNEDLMDSLGLTTVEELNRELEKQRVRNTEMEIESGESNADKVSYYAFNTSKLGWMNCDRFTKSKPLISMKTGVTRKSTTDAKLVFRSFKSVMPSNNYNGEEFDFQRIKKNEPVYYIVLKYTNDGIFLSLNATETDENAPKVDFESVSLEELKERLAVLD
jgi:hypothetical protein